MYCTFQDKMACLYEHNRRQVRKFFPDKAVLGAQVSGDNVIAHAIVFSRLPHADGCI